MFASRTLNAAEKKYQIYEQECLAVVWAVELFRDYIRNHRTVVRTDCYALQWLKTREEGSRVMRWIMRLKNSTSTFNIAKDSSQAMWTDSHGTQFKARAL